MEQLSIRIKIGDREYPMKVKAEEEARIRQAGKLINEKLKNYREQFGLDDKQDLLAMVAFDSTVAVLEARENTNQDQDYIADRIQALSQLIATQV
ncbi:cell division protein ZapA [Penaeicola halotolerans]|uniref:cell division protein ZapA n=1 Tax=Penaeicola halotolerans TaxID=2793196 RepID=UPI001CF89D0C|nr:cell division protein ZapA [Penaeicola halotolerans]